MDTPETAPNRVVSESLNFELKNPEKDQGKKVWMRKSKSLKLDDEDSFSSENNKIFEEESSLE